MSAAPAIQWEHFFRDWDAVFGDPQAWEKVTESSVAGNFAGELLRLLWWKPTESLFEVNFNLQVGHKQKSVFPDIVLAPGRDVATTPGKVYAVIELKRPGEGDSEAARLQARCYADHLRAPVYAVIDGERIRIWHRRLVHEDVLELELVRHEFERKFDEVRKHLGRSELETLHAELNRSADEVAAARERAATADHSVPSLRLRLESGRAWASCTRDEFLDAARWWGPPTGSASRLRLSVVGAFDDWTENAPDLVRAIARVAVHEHQVMLAVDDPKRWEEELKGVPLNLERHHATAVHAHADDRLDPPNAESDMGTPEALADDLHRALDAWAQQKVAHEIKSILRGMGSTKHWNREDVREKLRTPWDIDTRWLTSALRANASDDAHARRRLGPRTIPYLVDAVLFPMAVDQVFVCLRPGATPGFPHNLDYTNNGTRVGFGFAYAMAQVEDLEREAFLLVLTCSSLTPAHIRPRQRIGEPPAPVQASWRIGARTEHGIVCCLSDDVRRILASEGWTTFESHLKEAIRAQIVPQEGDP